MNTCGSAPHRWPISRLGGAAAVCAATILAAACSSETVPVAPSPPPAAAQPAQPEPAPIIPDGVLVGAADVAMCGAPEAEATAKLLDGLPGTVFAAGDLAYPAGSARDFETCYEPTWGRHKRRTRPAPGNHDYQTLSGAPYYSYFGQNAGPAGLGYYSYREGSWLVVSLNSNIAAGPASAQAAWLRSTLAANPAACTLAYWHHPLFTSGPNGTNAVMRDIWRILQEAGADVVISGHDHLYERFAPQDASGRADPIRGLRQFTVGTGGAHLYEAKSVAANSQVIGSFHGVLKLTLKADSYDWQFIAIPGKSFGDFGNAQCHGDASRTDIGPSLTSFFRLPLDVVRPGA
jgi:acid phosphatase type 7